MSEREPNRLITIDEMRTLMGFKSISPILRMRKDKTCPIKFHNMKENGETKNRWRVWLWDVLDYIDSKQS